MTPFLFAIPLPGCAKDPTVAASSAECTEACAHATGLNKGEVDMLTQRCEALCVERRWTVGDLGCLSAASTYEAVQSCAVAAMVVTMEAKQREERLVILAEQKALEEEKKKLEAKLKEQNDKIDHLLSELANAKDEAQRAALQKQLDDSRKARPGARPAPPECKCAPKDPLCSCL